MSTPAVNGASLEGALDDVLVVLVSSGVDEEFADCACTTPLAHAIDAPSIIAIQPGVGRCLFDTSTPA
jgi:hypothetical protein